jgi:hypothetical protein
MKVSNKASQVNSILRKAEFIDLGSKDIETVQVYQIQMTKEIAQYMLDNNFESQRKLSMSRAKKYAEEMLSGNWRFNGECITIDNNGKLINGQHRCKGVVLSGVEIPVMVITGLESESFKTMDQGFKRGTGQIFSMMGVKNSTLMTSSLKIYCQFLKTGKIHSSSHINSSTLELEKIYNKNPNEFDKIVLMANRTATYLKFSGFTTTMFGALTMANKDDPKVYEFLDKFNNQNWTKDDKCPIKFLHNVIAKARGNKMRFTAMQKSNALIVAWNHFKADKPLPLNSYLWMKSTESIKIK